MKTTRRFSLAGLAFIILIIISYSSCQKEIDKHADQQLLKIYLTDDPVAYDAVNIDIQQVEVKILPDSCRNRENDEDDDDDGDHDGDHDSDDDHDNEFDGRGCAVWDTLDINPGVYNILNFSNGLDTLLATGFTPAGKILKVRLTLGDNNSVVIDSVSYPLHLYNNNHHITISIKHDEEVEQLRSGTLQMFLDFDASRSIVVVNNNQFVLRPRIGVFVPGRTAAIEGRVTPGQAKAVISAYTSTDTLVAIPRDDGEFKIRGLNGTSAELFINATANGYRDTTITGIHISAGHETDIGTIKLKQ